MKYLLEAKLDALEADRAQLAQVADLLLERFPRSRGMQVDAAVAALLDRVEAAERELEKLSSALDERSKALARETALRAELARLEEELARPRVDPRRFREKVELAVQELMDELVGLERASERLEPPPTQTSASPAAFARSVSAVLSSKQPPLPAPAEPLALAPEKVSLEEHQRRLAKLQDAGRRIVGGVKSFAEQMNREPATPATVDGVKEALGEAARAAGDPDAPGPRGSP